jgi:hypothetical protein
VRGAAGIGSFRSAGEQQRDDLARPGDRHALTLLDGERALRSLN